MFKDFITFSLNLWERERQIYDSDRIITPTRVLVLVLLRNKVRGAEVTPIIEGE